MLVTPVVKTVIESDDKNYNLVHSVLSMMLNMTGHRTDSFKDKTEVKGQVTMKYINLL